MDARVTWQSGMTFTADQDGHTLTLDVSAAAGGQGLGPRPKTLLLTALAGCTAMDVVSLLAKMRVRPDAFEVTAAGDLTDDHPRVFRRIHLTYTFTGADLSRDKLERAVALSQERYCGVSAMLAPACPITHEIAIHD